MTDLWLNTSDPPPDVELTVTDPAAPFVTDRLAGVALMSDVYLVTNDPYGPSDVLLVTAAPSPDSGAANPVTAGGAVRYPNPLPPHRPTMRRNDDEEVLIVSLL